MIHKGIFISILHFRILDSAQYFYFLLGILDTPGSQTSYHIHYKEGNFQLLLTPTVEWEEPHSVILFLFPDFPVTLDDIHRVDN